MVFERFGIEWVVEYYGVIEMLVLVLMNWMGRFGYCGFIFLGYFDIDNVVLVDEKFKVVVFGEVGEVLLRVLGNIYWGYFDL